MGYLYKYAIECWPLYGLGILFIAFRSAIRIKTLGLKKLHGDDYLILVAAVFFTAMLITGHYIAASELQLEDIVDGDSSSQQSTLIYVSKLQLAFEQCYVNLMLCVKGCMLFMFSRLAIALKDEAKTFIRVVTGFVVIAWVGTQIAYFLTFNPPSILWESPYDEVNARLRTYLIIQLALHMASDVVLLVTPVPFAIRATLPIRLKFTLVVLYGLGIFTIVIAIINKVYSFEHLDSISYLSWYVVEGATAIYICNLPIILPYLVKLCGPTLLRSTTADPERKLDRSATLLTNTSFKAV